MTRWKNLIMLGVGGYLVFLVTTFPARIAYQRLGDRIAPLALTSVEGSVWRGKAGEILYRGLPLGSVTWRFRPLALLAGKLEYGFEQSSAQMKSTGRAGSDVGGDIYLEGIKGEMPAALLGPLADIRLASLGGQLAFDMAEIQFSDDRVSHAMGDISWSDGSIDRPVAMSLGDFKLNVYSEETDVIVDVIENQGPFGIDGYSIFSADGTFKLSAKLQPTPEAPQSIVSTFRAMGQAVEGDKIALTYTGRYE